MKKIKCYEEIVANESYTTEDEKMYCSLLKLIKIRIEGLRKDFVRQYYRQQERIVHIELQDWDFFVGDSKVLCVHQEMPDIIENLTLIEALSTLSEQDMEIVHLHCICGIQLTEIAKIQGVSVQAISRRKQQILRRLSQQLKGEA